MEFYGSSYQEKNKNIEGMIGEEVMYFEKNTD